MLGFRFPEMLVVLTLVGIACLIVRFVVVGVRRL